MTTQKIANILFSCGYNVFKNYNGYETSYYSIYDIVSGEKVFGCKGAKDLKDFFKAWNNNYDFIKRHNPLNIPKFTLEGIAQ